MLFLTFVVVGCHHLHRRQLSFSLAKKLVGTGNRKLLPTHVGNVFACHTLLHLSFSLSLYPCISFFHSRIFSLSCSLFHKFALHFFSQFFLSLLLFPFLTIFLSLSQKINLSLFCHPSLHELHFSFQLCLTLRLSFLTPFSTSHLDHHNETLFWALYVFSLFLC